MTTLSTFLGTDFSGFVGSRGNTGFVGSKGDIGYTGSAGSLGVDGYTGSQGTTGFVGSRGDLGYTGSIGFTGSQGAGFTGSQGNTGFVGSKGDIGYTGSQGAGFTGSQGAGFTGSRGDTGFTGSGGLPPEFAPTFSSSINGSLGPGIMTISGLGTNNGLGGTANNFGIGSYVRIYAVVLDIPREITGTITQIFSTSFNIDTDYVNFTAQLSTTWTMTLAAPKGFTGSKGNTGFTGSQGDLGYTGSTGFTGSQGALLPWSIKNSNYTLVNGDRIIANTSSGSFTLTLPATPTVGTYFQITDGYDLSINPVTIARNGSTIEGITDDVLLTIPNTTYEFVYDGTTWQLTATAGPIGYTGSRGPSNILPVTQAGSYTLQASDSSKFVSITSTGTVTVPPNVFSVGDPITVYNATTSTISIAEGIGVTMYLVGTATTGTRSLDQKGLATILCVGTNTFVVTGGGLT